MKKQKAQKTQVKLNLGCGLDKRKGWVNIDAFAGVDPDLVHDLLDPLPFKNDSVDYILAQDILEHFTKEDVQKVIAEIGRVLKKGGQLEVRVPNIEDIIDRFADDAEVRNEFLYGTTEVTGVFGAHKVGFTPELMTLFMLSQGLRPEVIETEVTNYHFIFVKDFVQPSLQTVYCELGNGLGKEQQLLSVLKNEQIKVVTQPPKNILSLFNDIRKNRPQALVLAGFTEYFFGSWIGVLLDIPVVWLELDQPARHFSKWGKLAKVFYYFVRDIPQLIIVPSVEARNLIVQTAHVSLSNVVVLQHKETKKTKQLKTFLHTALLKSISTKMVYSTRFNA